MAAREPAWNRPISPRLTRREKPGRDMRWNSRLPNADPAACGDSRKMPAVSAAIPNARLAASAARRGPSPRVPPWTAGALRMARRISAPIRTATAKPIYSTSAARYPELSERKAAAASPANEMAAVAR